MDNAKYPNRKIIRLKEYDYSKSGCYYITICTKNRKEILGNVGVALMGDPQNKDYYEPKMLLSKEGKIIKKHIERINRILTNITINEYTIMPNHVHFIIELQNGSPMSAPPTVGKIINSFKSIITKEIGQSIWQRNYYEHIIRNDTEYKEICEYIQTNIVRWYEKNK